MHTLARIPFAIAVAGLGVLNLVYGDFAPQWQSVPAWFPWPHALAYVSGVVLFAGGIGVLVERVAVRAALVVTGYLSLWAVVRAGELLPSLASIDRWYAVAEALGPVTGGLILASRGSKRTTRVARVLFGGSCLVFGLAHFAFADFTAHMVPAWLPARRGLAHATGAAHVAAGLGIVSSVRERLAATLEATMLGCFVLLVHVPSLVASPAPEWAPSAQGQWAELLLALVMAGAAGIVAASARERTPGGSAR